MVRNSARRSSAVERQPLVPIGVGADGAGKMVEESAHFEHVHAAGRHDGVEGGADGQPVAEGGDEAAVVESVKAASEVYSPVSGEVVAVNADLEGAPGGVNEDAMGKGWFVKVRLADKSEFAKLMDEDAYKSFVEGLA